MGVKNLTKKLKKASVEHNNVKRYFHYTVFQHLISISESGVIGCTSKMVFPNERPAVWFSTNTAWEETVRKSIRYDSGEETAPLSRDELFKRGKFPVRIEVDPTRLKLIPWKKHKLVSGITKDVAKGLELSGKNSGANPEEWYSCFDDVPFESCCIGLEIWNGTQWEAFPKPSEVQP